MSQNLNNPNRSDLLNEGKNEAGASMVEYALIAVLIAVVCIGGAAVMGQATSTKFSNIASAVTSTPTN